METSLPVVNLTEATFECTFGRGCEGICCKNGRPFAHPDEIKRVKTNLKKFLPEMRPAARDLVQEDGFVSGRRCEGLPMLRVVEGWCVFYNQGCVLHKVGADEGDSFRYKPSVCALFPLWKDEKDGWYVRQWHYKGEKWNDLFCLNPANTKVRAADSLHQEMDLAAQRDRQKKS